MTEYDGIIIGAGPNGLTLGSYLAKAGLKILLLDRRLEIGGGLATEQVTIPGFLHNTHAVYHMMVDYAPIFKDLRLFEESDLKFVKPEPAMVLPLSDGRSICLYSDIEKTCASIAQFSKHDSDCYRDMAHEFQTYVDEFLAPATYAPSMPPFEQLAKLTTNEIGQGINELTEKTPRQIVDERFENEHVRALFLYAACMWGLDYDLEGVSFLVPLLINRAANYRLCVGGTHHLAHVLSQVIYRNGGMILGPKLVKRIVVEGGAAKGVELEDGTVYRASKFIASSLNPHQTFMQLVGAENLDANFVQRIHDWQWEKYSLFGVHLALEHPPHFKAADNNPDVDKGFVYIVGYETEQDLVDHWEAIKRGELGDGGFNAAFPSVHDPLQAPRGKATALLSQHAPFRLHQGAEAWYGPLREEHADRCVAKLRKYATNISDEDIIWRYISTPLDIHNKFQTMQEGSIKHGAYIPFQMGFLRPNEECSQHVTSIKNLYVCGASTFPGGMVIFGPGYNAANVIAAELGIEKWWSEPEMVTRAKETGML
ncbi:MAG: NAD(P)/FAD-dependent oxidoreductase [Chloroflexi bacterium]|nr:NAD(P)/FAD-dependent oxidoreductase [Chloroflexota bacterium]